VGNVFQFSLADVGSDFVSGRNLRVCFCRHRKLSDLCWMMVPNKKVEVARLLAIRIQVQAKDLAGCQRHRI
jgi:hypothetical protein